MTTGRDVILLAGLWLTGRIWEPVSAELVRLGHRPVVPALPGADDRSRTATLDDQLAAVLDAVDASDHPVVVGHSAAVTLAWLAADRRPDTVARVVLIGGFPTADGESYADFCPVMDDVMPFPGWAPFEGADSADIDDATRERFLADAVPVPTSVSQATVTLSNERRYAVPVTEVCPEFSPDDARAWRDAGQTPELARARDVTYVDLDSGHWPMLTRPVELATLVHRAATGG